MYFQINISIYLFILCVQVHQGCPTARHRQRILHLLHPRPHKPHKTKLRGELPSRHINQQTRHKNITGRYFYPKYIFINIFIFIFSVQKEQHYNMEMYRGNRYFTPIQQQFQTTNSSQKHYRSTIICKM